MAVRRGENKRLALQTRVDVLRQLLGDDAVEFLRDDAPVEGLDFEGDLVGDVREVDLSRARVEQFNLFSGAERNPPSTSPVTPWR